MYVKLYVNISITKIEYIILSIKVQIKYLTNIIATYLVNEGEIELVKIF